jgi:hypothetical protein
MQKMLYSYTFSFQFSYFYEQLQLIIFEDQFWNQNQLWADTQNFLVGVQWY